ncbi:MAG: lysophospholipid acyltransferase family protein [Lentisphaeria bacterium]|nr:lysophospholipid acyltransferase family protein [Lentisphaeria bacterium]
MSDKPKLKKKFRDIKKLPDWCYWLPSHIILWWRKLSPTEIIDPNGLLEEYRHDPHRVCIVNIWHNRLLMLPPLFERPLRERTVAVVSASRDGQYVADFASQFNAKCIRGSTKRHGLKVLHDAIKTIQGGCMVVITPDGPRGPRYHMSKGPIHIASQLGIPVVALGINYSSYWAVRSWDGFRIPKPWARLTVIIGNELRIPPDLNDEELERWRKEAEKELNRASLVEAKDYL